MPKWLMILPIARNTVAYSFDAWLTYAVGSNAKKRSVNGRHMLRGANGSLHAMTTRRP
jgi:hypothetical protein